MTTTESLVAEAQAVETVFREDGDRMWRTLFVFSGDPDIASDAVAEAFAQALRRGAAIRDVRRWVWRAAYRVASGDLKQRSVIDRGPVPDVAAAQEGIDLELLGALRRLTPQQRTVLTLFYYVDCPVREIARRTGLNALAVRAHLSRGRKRLREVLGEEDA